MIDLRKEPALYYILVPIAVALWPLLLWGVYLPGAERNWNLKKSQYTKAQGIMEQILTLDPDRLEFADPNAPVVEFDYANAVEKVASLPEINIKPADYRLSSGIIITSGGQKSQGAKVVLKGVNITKFARFLSTIQLRWANLQCTQFKLTKKKGLPDTWDVDLDFKYYY